MSNTSTFLLESKLKRLKISFSKENGKIVISNAKLDLLVLFLLVFFPFVLAVCTSLFLIISTAEFSGKVELKIIGLIVFFLSVAIVNGLRIRSKLKANKNRKILDHKIIKIIENEQVMRFEASNVKDFEYTTKQLDKEIYEGKLFLIDTNNQKHLLLGFDDENEQYVLDDLYWFIDYFKKHLEF